MKHVAALAASLLLAGSLSAQTVANPRFDNGLTGWTITPTAANAAGAPGSVSTFDMDGGGPLLASPAATFACGTTDGSVVPQGVAMTQTVFLQAGIEYTLRVDWSIENQGSAGNSDPGRFRIFILNEVFEDHVVGTISAGTTLNGVLSETFVADVTGPAEVLVRVTRGFGVPGGSTPTLLQRIDNVRLEAGLSGSPNFIQLPFASDETLSIDAGPLYANHFYWMIGSVTGTTPGIDLPGDVHVPLNFDPYMGMTLGQPFMPVFQDYLGFLDVNGRATAVFKYPGGLDPEFSGVVVRHAVLLAPNFGDDVNYASNGVAAAIF